MIEPPLTAPPSEVLRREQEFHDALSSPLVAASMPPRAPDDLERELLGRAGDIRGLRVLELGCGTGDFTLQLVAAGATVTALDLSPGMVDIARRRVEAFARSSDTMFVVAPVECSGLPPQRFDLVIGKWILHHSRIPAAADEISRLLRRGGRGLFAENSGANPLLALSRRYLAGRWGIPRYGTVDEHPLTARDYSIFAQRFSRVELHFPDFCFFQLFDRQILRFRHPLMTRLFRFLDKLIATFLVFRRYSYHVILEVGF